MDQPCLAVTHEVWPYESLCVSGRMGGQEGHCQVLLAAMRLRAGKFLTAQVLEHLLERWL